MAKPRTAAENKAAKAQAQADRKAAARERRAQLWQAFKIQRQEDRRLLPYMIGAFVLIVGASVTAGVLVGGFTMITLILLGVVLGGLVTFIIFSRRAQRSVYRKAEGQVPLAKLERHLNRLPANITAKQMDSLESRLAALGSRAGAAVMPKGPLPNAGKMRGVQRTVRRK
jgi:hypothetical protein